MGRSFFEPFSWLLFVTRLFSGEFKQLVRRHLAVENASKCHRVARVFGRGPLYLLKRGTSIVRFEIVEGDLQDTGSFPQHLVSCVPPTKLNVRPKCCGAPELFGEFAQRNVTSLAELS